MSPRIFARPSRPRRRRCSAASRSCGTIIRSMTAPRMSQHLHLRGFTGRPAAIAPASRRPRHQPRLAADAEPDPGADAGGKLCRAAKPMNMAPAFDRAATPVLGETLAERVRRDLLALQDRGLDRLAERRKTLRERYAAFDHPAAARDRRLARRRLERHRRAGPDPIDPRATRSSCRAGATRRAARPRPGQVRSRRLNCASAASFSSRSQARGAASLAPRAGLDQPCLDPLLRLGREILEGDRMEHHPADARLRLDGRALPRASRRRRPASTGGGSSAARSSAASSWRQPLRLVGPDISEQPLAVGNGIDRIEVDARAPGDLDRRVRRRRPFPFRLQLKRRLRPARPRVRRDRSRSGRAGG